MLAGLISRMVLSGLCIVGAVLSIQNRLLHHAGSGVVGVGRKNAPQAVFVRKA